MKENTFSRRDVLKAGCTLACGMAAPHVITSSALGNADKPAASERITLGFIGVGSRGGALVRAFQRCKEAQTVAVADPYQSRRESLARVLKAKAYNDFTEITDRDAVDAVVIATPDHWHVPMAIMAARAGKDAYVEKPLGLSIEQDLACRKAFQGNQRIFQYGTHRRSFPRSWHGCELVRRGVIGELQRIELIFTNGAAGGSTEEVPIPEGFDYDMWNGPAQPRPYTVDRCKRPGTYWIYDYSVGYLGGFGAHSLDMVIFATDADQSGLIEIEGTGVIPTEGLYDTVYNWDIKGKFGDVEITMKPGKESTKFIGPNGWVNVWRNGCDASNKEWLEMQIDPAEAKLPVISGTQQQDFINSVKSRQEAIAPVGDSVRSDIITHLCDIAIRTGRKITWDPKKETIVGDEEAAKRMHRPMRARWTL